MKPLILASSSPYKKMLFERLQLPFACHAPNIDESKRIDESARELASRLAQEKALAIATKYPNSVVIGADQVGEINGEILGKPSNHQVATQQLLAQSGQTSQFHCGIAVTKQVAAGNFQTKTRIHTTRVTFRTLSEEKINNYLLADTPYDCAGSFKSEGLGISLFSSVDSSDPSALVGLPLVDLCSLLAEFDIELHQK
jgi:septum formation protein